MFKILWPGALPNDKLQIIFHPSIDKLLEISNGRRYINVPLPKKAAEFSAILRHLRIGNFWKYTKPHRLIEADRQLSTVLRDNKFKKIDLLDVGASDGITTLDLVNYLTSKYDISANNYLVDRYLFIKRLERNHIVEYVTSDGQPIMVRIGPLAFMLRQSEFFAKYLPNLNTLLNKLMRNYLNLTSYRSKMKLTAMIPLINPAVLRANNISLHEMDITDFDASLINSFDVIRASNIITKVYFSDNLINQVIDIFHHYLREGGFLLISRNMVCRNDDVEIGSIWCKSGKRFVHIADLTEPSEIMDIVNQYNSTS